MSEQQTTTPTRPRTSDQIRAAYIEFFKNRPGAEHQFFASSPVVPHDDPTLLFTNAGMNQYKPVFLNQTEPGSDLAKLVAAGARAVNSQKCIRAGGKHNDLDDVGKDTYHHTFFEMLGNWSFGDYFKAEAIAWAWEFLTEVCQIPADRLYATYFEGDESLGLAPDTEARDLWLQHLPADHVLPGNAKDNFWEMGDTGPCGPCSEVHYDRVGERNAAPLVNMDDPDVIEVWNLVFIQFDRQEGGTLKPLPANHVDTGMGFERLTSVQQNVRSNYDTDIFAPIFEAIERHSRAPHEYTGRMGDKDEGHVDEAYRVIADHIRTLTFAIVDGAQPSNEGRGYVLRRVLRRAVRYGRQMLGAETGFLSALVPTVVAKMGDAFPELKANPDRVRAIILDEEESFGRTLDRGIKLFDEAASDANQITGEDAFKLYDTFGFPIDLTQLMAAERGLTVDTAGFDRLMQQQRERSRAGGKDSTDRAITLDPEALARLAHLKIDPTDDSAKFDPPKHFSARVRAIHNGKNFDDHADLKNASLHPVGVILDKTPFYAEMGGQVADTGRINGPHGEMKITDTKSFGGYVLHLGTMVKGTIKTNDTVDVHIDESRRAKTAANHTATHLLNLGLRKAVGDSCDQKGSLVDPEHLRFDFANSGPLEPAQIAAAEQTVREQIAKDLTVFTLPAALDDAKQISGLRAVFGEKYPDPVRVVSIGAEVGELLASPSADAWRELSIEFCGGTHLKTTGEAKAFALVSETGIAKGIRRVEALTGVAAQAAIATADSLETRINEASSKQGEELIADATEIGVELDQLTMPLARKHELRAKLAGLQEKVKAAQKQAAGAQRERAAKLARQVADSAAASLEEVIVATLELGADREALLAATETIQNTCPKAAVLVVATGAGDKAPMMASVPNELVKRGLKAGDWIKTTTSIMGGKGGGKPTSAQGAGADLSKLKEAVKAARTFGHQALHGAG